jgi:hypothetical protein
MTSLVVARTRSPVPHCPVRKKNGTSIRSKKTTNSARSCAISAPSTAVSPSARWKKNSLGRSHERSDAHTVDAVHRTVVSRIRKRFSPSTPSFQRIPSSEIQRSFVTYCSPLAPLSKSATMTIA